MRAFSFDGRPSRTSGAAYMNVPPKAVVDEKKSARDSPMSETLARPSSVSSMLDGFTSLLNNGRHVSDASASAMCNEHWQLLLVSSCTRTFTCTTGDRRMSRKAWLHCQSRSTGIVSSARVGSVGDLCLRCLRHSCVW